MSSRVSKVLCSTDLSEVAENALHTAIAIAKRQGAELVLVHVLEERFYMMPPEASPVSLERVSADQQEVNDKLNLLAAPIAGRFEIPVRTAVLTGDVAGEICRWSMDNDVDMIVMGTHGASGLREFFIGSNAYRVVKYSTIPVMTIPGDNRWIEFRRILFPIRLVPSALSKYDVIRPIIRQNGSSLLIAGIVMRGDSEAGAVMEDLIRVIESKMKSDEVECRSEVHFSENIPQHVLHLSQAEKPDLLVITATFDSGNNLKSFFMGPYTQQIVNHCRFPVLSIRGME